MVRITVKITKKYKTEIIRFLNAWQWAYRHKNKENSKWVLLILRKKENGEKNKWQKKSVQWYDREKFPPKRLESSDPVPEKEAQKYEGQNVLWKVIELQGQGEVLYRYPIKAEREGKVVFKRKKIQFDLRFIQSNIQCYVIVQQPTEFQGEEKVLH